MRVGDIVSIFKKRKTEVWRDQVICRGSYRYLAVRWASVSGPWA